MGLLTELPRYTRRSCQAAVFGTAILTLWQSPIASAQSTWVSTKTGAHAARNAVLREYVGDSEAIAVAVVLKLRNADKIDGVLANLTTPGSPQFQQWMTPEQVLADYAPTEDQVQAVVNHLTRSGFTNVQVAPNRLVVTAKGTAGAARKGFNTQIARFARDGREAIANVSPVSVPVELGDTVLSVLGLQTLDVAHTANVQPHLPTEFPHIYDASGLPAAAKTTVGIVTVGDMTQTIADLHLFESQSSLPTLNPSVVHVCSARNGSICTSSDTSGTLEWDLDSQNLQAMAGGTVAQMIFYTATSFTNADLTVTYNRAVTDGSAKVINVSLQECETATNNDGSMAADDAIFRTAILQGQTFVIASGDHGSKECGTGANGAFGTVAGESYPASSPYVIAAGGTTVSTDNIGTTYLSEAAWTFSGGGPSLYESQPSWQTGVVPGTKRGVPDISFDSDPASGAEIYFNGGLMSGIGGTSLAAPLFAGSWARIQSAHNNALGFPAPWIYGYGSKRPASAFHDVTSGSNGDYTAGVGWDFVTGWGTFDVAAVNAAIGGNSTAADLVPIISLLLQ